MARQLIQRLTEILLSYSMIIPPYLSTCLQSSVALWPVIFKCVNGHGISSPLTVVVAVAATATVRAT